MLRLLSALRRSPEVARACVRLGAVTLTFVAASGALNRVGAQVQASAPTMSRPALEKRIADAESAVANSREEGERKRQQALVESLRERLRVGDFQPGDRVLLSVTRGEFPRDTVVVRPDTTVVVTGLAPISVRGVLRSELATYLQTKLGEFVREPSVTVVPLLRVGVFGGVRMGGYFDVPADLRVTDLLMRAGGPLDNADPQKLVLRRGTKEVLGHAEMGEALRAGRSLDEIGVQGGDDFNIALKRRANWGTLLQWFSVAASLVTVLAASR